MKHKWQFMGGLQLECIWPRQSAQTVVCTWFLATALRKVLRHQLVQTNIGVKIHVNIEYGPIIYNTSGMAEKQPQAMTEPLQCFT